MKNKIIVVGGYPAAGKSTFARKLSKLLSIPCFIKDTIKEELGNGFGPENDMVFQKGSFSAFMLMLHIAEQFLQAGKACILESNFKLKESEQIIELLARYDGECLTYIFGGDIDIIVKRYMEREKERHWVHRKTGGNNENFKSSIIKSGCIEVKIGQTISIDTTSFINVNYKELIDAARYFIFDSLKE